MLHKYNDAIALSKFEYNNYFRKAFDETSHATRYNYARELNLSLNDRSYTFKEMKLIIAAALGHVRASSANHYSY